MRCNRLQVGAPAIPCFESKQRERIGCIGADTTIRLIVMTLALQILYFEDLKVGMTERLSKTVASSDVVGFAQVTGDRNPIHLSEHFRRPHTIQEAHRAWSLYREPDLGGARNAPARSGRRLYLPEAQLPCAGKDRRYRRGDRRGGGTDPRTVRARLACTCKVAGEVVLDGEAWVKVPSSSAPGRPLPRI